MGWVNLLLSPLGWPYFAGTKLKMKLTQSFRTDVPVICVGNIMVGGVGKTPIVLEIVKHLQAKGQVPHILSRGYGGSLEYKRVNTETDTAKEVGDEPLMMAKQAPVWIGKDRKKTAKLAIREGATVLIMDDGFQNKSIRKDYSILVFDGKVGIGRGIGLPLGRLRESLNSGLKRTDCVVIVGKDQTKLRQKIKKKPIFYAEYSPIELPDMRKKYSLFAGIGRPEKFFETISNLGLRVVETNAFPDHYLYKTSDIERLIKSAIEKQANLLTTEKDWVRIEKKFQEKIAYLAVEIKFQNPSFFDEIDLLLKIKSL